MRLKFKIIFTAAILCLAGVSILAGLSLLKFREVVELRKQASFAQGTLDDVLQSLQAAQIYHFRAQLTGVNADELLVAVETHRADTAFETLSRTPVANAPEIAVPLAHLRQLISAQISRTPYDGTSDPLSNEVRREIEIVDRLLDQAVNTQQLFVDKYFGLNVGALGLALLFTLVLLFAFMFSVSQEIGRRTKLEEELRKAQVAAVSASNLKSQFVATVSHEIRTPLNGIIGMSELVRDRVHGPELKRYAEILHNSGQNLLRIVNDVLDFSKIEANRFEFEIEEVCPSQIIERAVELFAKRASEKRLLVIGDYENGFLDFFATDGTRISQVLLNLLGNAIKFTDRGYVQLIGKVERGSDQSYHLKFEVIDSGCGFSQEDRGLLFRPFTQLLNARNQEGTGLGLTICKRLVESMGGEIGVSSQEGRGSRFWFRLPVQFLRANATSDILTFTQPIPKAVGVGLPPEIDQYLRKQKDRLPIDYQGIGEWPTEASANSVVLVREAMPILNPGRASLRQVVRLPDQITPERLQRALHMALHSGGVNDSLDRSGGAEDLQNALILLVEDNATNQILAQALLEGMGYRVHVAGNGKEGLEALARVNYSLVLMDCRMPVMDGLTATRHIRERELQEGRLRLPIIAITANATEADREKCLAAGMDDYMGKPFDPAQLSVKVRAWARGIKPAVDWDIVKQLASRTNHEIVRRLMESMITTLSNSIPKLEHSLEMSDWPGLSGIAHQLKASSATLGALRFSEWCETVESEIDAGTPPPEEHLVSMILAAQQVLEEIRSRRLFK